PRAFLRQQRATDLDRYANQPRATLAGALLIPRGGENERLENAAARPSEAHEQALHEGSRRAENSVCCGSSQRGNTVHRPDLAGVANPRRFGALPGGVWGAYRPARVG